MRGVRTLSIENGRVIRHAVDQVNNDLTAELHWCATHVEPVWVFGDGSYECPHETVVGWPSDGGHDITPLPFDALPKDGAP